MLLKWIPWKFILRRLARAKGFVDPISLMARVSRFVQPSEVIAPVELLRAGVVLHARGLINSQAIQHNMDWIWPYWVEEQFNPESSSFIPRAFSLTHINLTHRNWTAVGTPGSTAMPVVDPRGLVMPFFDSWSLDAWILSSDGRSLIPSRASSVQQYMETREDLSVVTRFETQDFRLSSQARVIPVAGRPVLAFSVQATSLTVQGARLVVSVRPYNPEGISFINDIGRLTGGAGWQVNQEQDVVLSSPPEAYFASTYYEGDVYRKIESGNSGSDGHTRCPVGMASAAAVYSLDTDTGREITARVALSEENESKKMRGPLLSTTDWGTNLAGHCGLTMPDQQMVYLYDAALRTLILHTPDEVYAGPYTYKRFWFRDAAFILHAMLCAGLTERATKILDRILPRQQRTGYFESQFGEWDSNGQVLWLMDRFCRLTHTRPKPEWRSIVFRGYRWIQKKRRSTKGDGPHEGLLPAGFSAEHLGPNDYYYWDNFWSVGGLNASVSLLQQLGETDHARMAQRESEDLFLSIERSLQNVALRIGSSAMPASPYRRLDSGAIGSIVAGYPLDLFVPNDPRLYLTAEFLVTHCLSRGGFFHDIAHSGINPYLTLHLAQVFLKYGDTRFFTLMDTIKSLASPTGQWPEAIHPQTGCGCMGDGQHVWAAAEWLLMVRNCFIREVGGDHLVLCSGVKDEWYGDDGVIHFGPAPTDFGPMSLQIESDGTEVTVSWEGAWSEEAPSIEVRFPGRRSTRPRPGEDHVRLPHKGNLA